MRRDIAVQIVPPATAPIYRLRRSHLIAWALLLAVLSSAVVGTAVAAWGRAQADVQRLEAERLEQQQRLAAMERQAQALQKLDLDSARSIQRIERALGAARARAASGRPVRHASVGLQAQAFNVAGLGLRLRSLERASVQTRARTTALAGLATRVLNVRRLAAIARAQLIAAIPSLNPVNGGINAAFGWRTIPFPEFHKGLDLAAGYGTAVHAAAAGTVASAGWDGGFGIKIDLDHGNGYHTWYCHLSRSEVSVGQRIARGERIAAVGSTGESTGPHLHYQVMREGVAIDPQPFLGGIPANVLATLPQNPDVQ